ncbi:unnamed protein product [Camellia sinensis]
MEMCISSVECFHENKEIIALIMMMMMRGEPLVAKLAVLAKYAVLPGAMVAALIYSPPHYASSSSSSSSSNKHHLQSSSSSKSMSIGTFDCYLWSCAGLSWMVLSIIIRQQNVIAAGMAPMMSMSLHARSASGGVRSLGGFVPALKMVQTAIVTVELTSIPNPCMENTAAMNASLVLLFEELRHYSRRQRARNGDHGGANRDGDFVTLVGIRIVVVSATNESRDGRDAEEVVAVGEQSHAGDYDGFEV